MATQWQLIDRPAEFGAIRSALTGRENGGVVLVGAAGVGKTTLAEPSPSRCARRCTGWGAQSPRAASRWAFSRIVCALQHHATRSRMTSARDSLIGQEDTVIGVDDAHLLDQLSATLLHQIAVDRAGRILATIRSGEPVPAAVTALWKDGHLQRVELQPFTKAQCVALVESVLGGTLEGLSADVMWESSGGNPLFGGGGGFAAGITVEGGKDDNGAPRVTFEPRPAEYGARRDIVLEKCYRNLRPVLVSAHGLVFGVYRRGERPHGTGLVQMFDQPALWTDIGYVVTEGDLLAGDTVTLERTAETSPPFLEDHSDIEDLITFLSFDSKQEQDAWVAAQIAAGLGDQELRHSDIVH